MCVHAGADPETVSEGPGSLPQAHQSGLGSDAIPQRAGVVLQCSLPRVGARSFRPGNEPN